MSTSIVEHDDVDIQPLFNWNKAFEIYDGERVIPIYMRLVGDADMNRARVASLRRSGELRRNLRTDGSDERFAFIKDIEDVNVDTMVAVITVFSMRELTDKAIKNLKIKPPKPPRSDAKTETHEKYQMEVDAYPEKRRDEIRKLLDKEVKILNSELRKLPKEDLYKKYVANLINELCEQELLKAFKEWCTYFGTYADENLTTRLFKNFEEFANLPTDLKDELVREYSSIELHGENLKKLRQVTP